MTDPLADQNFTSQTIWTGDNLPIMRGMNSATVDLVYLDPPFNSNADYAAPIGSEAAGAEFKDTWGLTDIDLAWCDLIERDHPALHKLLHAVKAIHGDSMMSYLIYMTVRLQEMHRLLKPTGSIYLHCDPTAGHYLKLVMDEVFGKGNFRNEIVWRIGWVSGYKTQKHGWIRNHDTILYYVKTSAAAKRFNKHYIPYPEGYTRRDGSAPTGKGIPLEDTWNCQTGDILDSIMIKSFSREKLGYPTQKPVALLQRIIKASSNPGDLVLDPFCGCGTTLVAADALGRDWVGIDISPFAVDLMSARLGEGRSIPRYGMPADLESAVQLAAANPFEFEKWAITRVEGLAPNYKQRGDRGIDGRGNLALEPDDFDSDLVLAQVKAGKPALGQLRDFLHVVDRDRAAIGIFITLREVPVSWRAEAREAGTVQFGVSEYPRVQCWSIRDHFNGSTPKLPPLTDPFTGKSISRQRVLNVFDTP